MESLLRTRVSRFCLEDSLKLCEAEALMQEGRLMERILPIDGMFEKSPKAVIREEGYKWLINGNPLPEEVLEPEREVLSGEQVRVYDGSGRFYALYRYEKEKQRFSLVKMFFDREDG